MKNLTKLLLAGTAIAGCNAYANVPTQSYTVNSNVIANAKGNTAGLDFTKFNLSLGTLQSVKITLFSDFNTTISVENLSRNSVSTITGTAGSLLTMTVPTLTQTLTSSGSHVFSEAKFDGVSNFAGTSGGVFTFSGAPFSSTMSYVDLPTLALFSGVGNLHASLVGTSNSSVIGTSGNTRSLVQPMFDAYGSVTYTYALLVPEPENYAMLTAGLGLLGVALRRRKTP
ncbi:choice-of-anchor E domain-containing protein [Rugamonas aquatica]|uniref:Choice-of-anchor E domain-containing protein n=1 Tax=Rugamonas aquatica TaxID=2743357 RepID=A0A6A7N3J1_9BURK|nr:choice-of-anchor E domain-containing protein [Rugamonas aquatica]MQA39684.1 choice-of-anchor E domain-containing protein [Rugamonas aquatica]